MNNVQYYHFTKERMGWYQLSYSKLKETTVAVVAPDKEDLEELDFGDTVMVDVGLAYTSKKDRYVKRIGRQISKSRISPMQLALVAEEIGEFDTLLTFIAAEGIDRQEFVFKLSSKSNRVWFVRYGRQ